MLELFQAMLWPIMAALLLPPVLIFFGLRLLEKQNTFAALAFPQTALLGTALANAVHLPEGTSVLLSFFLTLVAGIVTALCFSRRRDIFNGIVFAFAFPATLFLFAQQTESFDEAKHMLFGNLLLVNKRMVLRTFAVGLGLAALWATTNQFKAAARLSDLAFYGLFAFAVANFAPIGAVVLTFSYLLIPAIAAALLARKNAERLILGWAIATGSTIVTIYLSYKMEIPSAATLLCILSLVLLLTLIFARFRGRWNASLS
jgi:ABC-type Mn2+/Zn2+ transport system permease subunit